MLSSWGIAFDGIDVEARPEAQRDLERLGVPRVPAVVRGGQAVHGWNPEGLAALLDVAYTAPTRLAPAALVSRLDRILGTAQTAIRQVPVEQLGATWPGRDRSVRQLAYHTFRLSLAFRDAMVEARLPEAWLTEEAPAELTDGAAVAVYGTRVRAALGEWLASRSREDFSGIIDTYYGPQTAHELLERTTWHATQHVRQLHALLARMGLRPADPLTPDDLAGLPLPAELW